MSPDATAASKPTSKGRQVAVAAIQSQYLVIAAPGIGLGTAGGAIPARLQPAGLRGLRGGRAGPLPALHGCLPLGGTRLSEPLARPRHNKQVPSNR